MMKDFVDLRGASGATYRFRAWPEGAEHLPVAGNYVIIRGTDPASGVLVVGATNDLSKVRARAAKLGQGAPDIYTRLNIKRETRAAEHADLLAAFPAAVGQGGAV